MGMLDDKLTRTRQAAPSFSQIAALLEGGSKRQSEAAAERGGILETLVDETGAQQKGALEELLREAQAVEGETLEETRVSIKNKARERGELNFADRGDVASMMTTMEKEEATERREVADQLIQDDAHKTAQELAEYNITQRDLIKDVKEHELLKNKTDLKHLETAEIRKEEEYQYKIGDPRRRLEEEAKRKEKIAAVGQEKKLKKAQSPARINEIFAKTYTREDGSIRPQTAKEFNTAARLHMDKGFVDPDGRLKARANEYARLAPSHIDQKSIGESVDLENGLSYTKAKYNTIIDKEYRRLKALHPFADETLLIKSAKDAVGRTEAGTKFADQKWFENLNRAEKDVDRIRARKTEVNKTWSSTVSDLSRTFVKMKKDRTDSNVNDFKATVSELNKQFANHRDDLGPGGLADLKSWTNKAIVDYTQNDLKPVQAFENKFSRQVKHPETGEMVTLPLGTGDYTPTNARAFIDAEVKKLSDQYPLADTATIQAAVVAKIKRSGLSVKFAEGALPAKLKAAANEYKHQSATEWHKLRSKRVTEMENAGGLTDYAYKAIYDRLSIEQKTDPKFDQKKLSDVITDTVKQWKTYIPNWTEMQTTNPEAIISYKQAMYEILAGVKIDKDWWVFDEDDFAISEFNRFGDVSGVKPNEALSAIAARLSPYGVGNTQLIQTLKAEVDTLNKAAAAARKEATKTGVLGGVKFNKEDTKYLAEQAAKKIAKSDKP